MKSRTAIVVNVKSEMIAVPAARPSSPSVRLTPFEAPAMTRKMKTYQSGPSGMRQPVTGRSTDVRCVEVGPVREVAGDGGDAGEQQQLPAPGEPERALVRELDEVVEEADQRRTRASRR